MGKPYFSGNLADLILDTDIINTHYSSVYIYMFIEICVREELRDDLKVVTVKHVFKKKIIVPY